MKEFIHHEESDFFSTSKDARQERKMARKRDRSLYKKTDQDKLQKKEVILSDKDLKKGIVVTIRPELATVESEGKTFTCTLRGTLKQDRSKLKNLVIVGDIVHFIPTDQGTGSIYSVEPRKSVLSRAEHLSHQKEHAIAANVDQVLITVSVVDPPLRTTIVDRYLIAAEKGGLRPIIICNKYDLLESPEYTEDDRLHEKEVAAECKRIYDALGIAFVEVSAATGYGMDRVKDLMKDKISVFSGQSGAGKSSLINAVTGLDLRVGRTVAATRKGAHTTSATHLLSLPFGGFCIDTPGIKSFGVWDLKEQDLRHFFDEIQKESIHCKYPDCRHDNEPDCAILKAVEEGKISSLRYESYLTLLNSLRERHLRR